MSTNRYLSGGGVSMPRLATRRVAILALAFGLSLVTMSGCGGDDRSRSINVDVPAVDPEPPLAPVTPPPDFATEPEQPADPVTEPTTNPCAFWDDPLCPGPIKVPPPDLSGW